MNDTQRRWLFRIRDTMGQDYIVGPDGYATSEDNAEPFIGTMAEAAAEADRRADAWDEIPQNDCPVRVTYESQGTVVDTDRRLP